MRPRNRCISAMAWFSASDGRYACSWNENRTPEIVLTVNCLSASGLAAILGQHNSESHVRMIMVRQCLMLVCLCLLAGCQRAQQYPPLGKKVEIKEEKFAENESQLREYSWIEPRPVRDTPIVFVAESNPEWATLKKFWNEPPPAVGLPTIHIGFAPLEIAASWAMVVENTVVKIKVPRGLPDPTPHVPAANPPSLGKWRLGKALFAMTIAKSLKRNYSCV